MFVWNSTHLTPINGAVQNSTISQQHHHLTTTLRDILNQKGAKTVVQALYKENIVFNNHFRCNVIFVNNNIFCPFFIGNVPMCTTTVFLAHFDSTTREIKSALFYFLPQINKVLEKRQLVFSRIFSGFCCSHSVQTQNTEMLRIFHIIPPV